MYDGNYVGPAVTIPNSLTATSATAEASAIPRQMALINKLLAENREVLSTVGMRLQSVLKPASPQANGEPSHPQRSSPSPMVTDLEQYAINLQLLLSGYQDILNRLEL